MKITCIIVDDEPNAAKLLREYVMQVPFLELQAVCADSDQTLAALETKKVQLIFLDINMPGLNGIGLANIISKEVKIIFITAYAEFAIESYEQGAMDYLLKPVSFKRFLVAVTRVREFFLKGLPAQTLPAEPAVQDFFFIKTGQEIVKILFAELKFIEASKEYIILNTGNKKITCYKRMKEIAGSLPAQFSRVHHSFIVNLHHVTKIDGNQLFIDDISIPISGTYRQELLEMVKRMSM
jgi:two-component system, LytTR family, response regulator